MKNTISKWFNVFGFAILAFMAMVITLYGVDSIRQDFISNPMVEVERSEPIIREVYAWYYEDGTIEDEQGQLWYFEDATAEGQMWKLWIDDNGTPADPTDDKVIDYTGG